MLSLALLPRATASYGEINSAIRNPRANASPANINAAFVFEFDEYCNRIISLWTVTPLSWLFGNGDAHFDGDEALAVTWSYVWGVEENFQDLKKWTKNNWRVVVFIDGEPIDTVMTPLIYNPQWDWEPDGIRDGGYMLRIGHAFKPGEFAEGEHMFNFQEQEFIDGAWEVTFDWNVAIGLDGFPPSQFWIDYN
jgi:hypothetical protein